MRPARALVLATIAWVFCAFTSLAQADWRTVPGPDGAFIVEMPGEPSNGVRRIGPSADVSYLYHSSRLTHSSEQFAADTFEMPPWKGVPQPRQALQELVDSAAMALREKKWLKTAWTEVEGALGIAVVGIGEDGRAVRGLFAVKGKRFVILTFGGASGK